LVVWNIRFIFAVTKQIQNVMTISTTTLSSGNVVRFHQDAALSTRIDFTVKRGKKVQSSGSMTPLNKTFSHTGGMIIGDRCEVKKMITLLIEP